MRESERPPTPPSNHDDALLERLREVADERDGVPEDVLAAARSLFARARHDHADEESEGHG